jgi:CheY-like chemotaxis protein
MGDVLTSIDEGRVDGESSSAETPEEIASDTKVDQDAFSRIYKFFGSKSGPLTPFGEKRILWVDTRPNNNVHLINSLEFLGAHVFLAYSNCFAKEMLQRTHYDVIITNMARNRETANELSTGHCDFRLNKPPPHSDSDRYVGGEELLAYLHEQFAAIPVIVYSQGWGRAHLGDEGQFGVQRITTSSADVYASILEAISKK